jgi:oligopeptide/dipeptide ABC transporter ATP-binding protein
MPLPDGSTTPLLRASDIAVHYPIRRGVLQRVVGHVRAVDGVSLSIAPGETLGLVGESGCGKSSLARALLLLHRPTQGEILFDAGQGPAIALEQLPDSSLRLLRRHMQIVFQDPYSSLNPRLRIGRALTEPLRAMGLGDAAERQARARVVLDAVGMPADAIARFPHEFSGGQRQRIGIARALAPKPRLVVLDEPVSSLDVSVRAQVLNLLQALQAELGLTYLFVSHDLSVVRYICDRVAVMYLGRIVEEGPTEALFRAPLHPYTEALLSALPLPVAGMRRARVRLRGDPPSPISLPTGCAFHPRCRFAQDRCRTEAPVLRAEGEGRATACHFAPGLELAGAPTAAS